MLRSPLQELNTRTLMWVFHLKGFLSKGGLKMIYVEMKTLAGPINWRIIKKKKIVFLF